MADWWQFQFVVRRDLAARKPWGLSLVVAETKMYVSHVEAVSLSVGILAPATCVRVVCLCRLLDLSLLLGDFGRAASPLEQPVQPWTHWSALCAIVEPTFSQFRPVNG